MNKIMLVIILTFNIYATITVLKPVTASKGAYTDFNSYVASRQDSTVSVSIGQDAYLSANCTSGVNIDITQIGRGVMFKSLAGHHYTLYISKMSARPMKQIFDTSITAKVIAGATSEVDPTWWFDGHNWTYAIQQAVNTGLDVKFTDRVYGPSGLKASIYLYTAKQHIKCAGIFYLDSLSSPLFILGQQPGGSWPSTTCRRPKISNLFCDILNVRNPKSSGISIRKATDIILDNIRIWEAGHGITTDSMPAGWQCLRSDFRDVECSYCGRGFYDPTPARLAINASNFYNCTFEANDSEGVILSSSNCMFHGGIIEGNGKVDSSKAEILLKVPGLTTGFFGTYFESGTIHPAAIICDTFFVGNVNLYGCRGSGVNDSFFVKSLGTLNKSITIDGGSISGFITNFVSGTFSGNSYLQIIGAAYPSSTDLISYCTFNGGTYFTNDRIKGIRTNQSIFTQGNFSVGDSVSNTSGNYGRAQAVGNYYNGGFSQSTDNYATTIAMWGNPQAKLSYLTKYGTTNEGFVFDTNGNAGIGFSVPVVRLFFNHISPLSITDNDIISNKSKSALIKATGEFGDSSILGTMISGYFAIGDSIFDTTNTNIKSVITLSSTVYSGAPKTPLHIKSANGSGIRIHNKHGATGDSATLGFQISSQSGGDGSDNAFVRAIKTAGGTLSTELYFGTSRGSSTHTNAIRLDTLGNTNAINGFSIGSGSTYTADSVSTSGDTLFRTVGGVVHFWVGGHK